MAGFIVFGKRAEAVWRYPAFRRLRAAGATLPHARQAHKRGSSPSCESLLFSRTAHDLLPQISPDRDRCEKIRGRCGRPVRGEVGAEKTFLGRCTPFSLGAEKVGLTAFGKWVEAVWCYLPLRAQRVLKEEEEIDKRRGNMGFPLLLPARAAQAQHLPPAAAGEIPSPLREYAFHKSKSKKRKPIRFPLFSAYL